MNVDLWRNSQHRYGLITKLLHGWVALLMIGLIALGWYMVDLSYYDPWYHDALNVHKAVGLLLLFSVLFKTGWMINNIRPELPATMARWERWMAGSVHRLLLALALVVPITGYAISTSSGDSISVFGWFDFPALLPISDWWRDCAAELHYFLAYGALSITVLHVLAAFKHQWLNGDGTLRKMFW